MRTLYPVRTRIHKPCLSLLMGMCLIHEACRMRLAILLLQGGLGQVALKGRSE